MAHDHEEIVYGMNEVKELFDAGVLTGTIVEVDTDNDKAHVNISGFGQINDVPIFYHCPGSIVVEGGSVAFSEGDSVYVLNKEGKVSPGASDLKVIGFTDKLKQCEFYIYITINGKTPEYTKTLKIVDNNDKEHILSSSEEEPNKIGPFPDVAWPAKIYLYYTGGGGTIFSYYKTPGAPGYYFKAKQTTNTSGCFGSNYRLSGTFGLYTPTGTEEFVLSADRVDYLLHGTFSSKPTSPINFTTKILGELQTKETSFNFGSCNNCGPVSETKNWDDDIDSIFYPSYVGDFRKYPNNCNTSWLENWCALCLGCQGNYARAFDSCSINDMGIMTDEDGQGPTFNGAIINVRLVGVIVKCFQLEITGPDDCGDIEEEICSYENSSLLGAAVWEFKMLPTPEDRI